MLQDAIDSLNDVFSPPFRRVMLKSLGLTLGVLLVVGVALDRFALSFVLVQTGWLATLISVMVGLGLVTGLIFLAAPTTSLVASFFFDEIAEIVERKIDPSGAPGRPMPVIDATLYSLRFGALMSLVMLVAIVLVFVPGIGLLAWWAANAYLLGREYFELAAMRFRPPPEARAMRRFHALPVYAAGLVIAAFVAIPLLNFFTPLFGAALMARLHKRLSSRSVGVAAA